jgi:hypothetical protein
MLRVGLHPVEFIRINARFHFTWYQKGDNYLSKLQNSLQEVLSLEYYIIIIIIFGYLILEIRLI